MAICIPVIFTTINYNNHYYVDGGIINNYPINIFNKNDKEVLGFIFLNKNEKKMEINSFQLYLSSIIFASIVEKEKSILKEYENISVVIDCNDYSSFNFDINFEDKKILFKIGYDSIENYYKKNI